MQDRVYPPVIWVAKLFFRLMGFRWQNRGLHHIPTTGGGVLVSNHVSYLDFMICGFAGQPSGRLVRFMAKDVVFTNRFSGPLMRGMHHIPVDRKYGAKAFADAVAALRAGEVVGVFPEATISQSFVLKSFKLGAARMAMDAGVPLIPMVTWGGQRVLTKGRRRHFGRGKTIAITIGEPFHVQPGDKAGTVTRELHRRMEQLLAETQAAYPDAPKGDGDGWWLPAHLGGTAPTVAEAAAEDARDARDTPAG